MSFLSLSVKSLGSRKHILFLKRLDSHTGVPFTFKSLTWFQIQARAWLRSVFDFSHLSSNAVWCLSISLCSTINSPRSSSLTSNSRTFSVFQQFNLACGCGHRNFHTKPRFVTNSFFSPPSLASILFSDRGTKMILDPFSRSNLSRKSVLSIQDICFYHLIRPKD